MPVSAAPSFDGGGSSTSVVNRLDDQEESEPPFSDWREYTVKQLQSATQSHPGSPFKIDGVEVDLVVVVAHVVNILKAEYQKYLLEDGSGRIMAELARPLHEYSGDVRRITPNAYTYVMGRIASSKKKNYIVIEELRPLGDPHEVFHHILQCMVVTEATKHKPPSPRRFRSPSVGGLSQAPSMMANLSYQDSITPLSSVSQRRTQKPLKVSSRVATNATNTSSTAAKNQNEALRNGRTRFLDAHRPDRHTPMEEIVRAFNYLINSGQALYWGTSEWAAEEIADAWGVANRLGLIGPLMEQPEYSMIKRDRVESEYHNLYRKFGLGLTGFSPLARGILTGKYNSGSIPTDSRAAKQGSWLRDQIINGKDMLARVTISDSDLVPTEREDLPSDLDFTSFSHHEVSSLSGKRAVTASSPLVEFNSTFDIADGMSQARAIDVDELTQEAAHLVHTSSSQSASQGCGMLTKMEPSKASNVYRTMQDGEDWVQVEQTAPTVLRADERKRYAKIEQDVVDLAEEDDEDGLAENVVAFTGIIDLTHGNTDKNSDSGTSSNHETFSSFSSSCMGFDTTSTEVHEDEDDEHDMASIINYENVYQPESTPSNIRVIELDSDSDDERLDYEDDAHSDASSSDYETAYESLPNSPANVTSAEPLDTRSVGLDPLAHFTRVERAILLYIQNCNQSRYEDEDEDVDLDVDGIDVGVSVTNVARNLRLGNMETSVEDVALALDRLLDEGFICSTIDENHIDIVGPSIYLDASMMSL